MIEALIDKNKIDLDPQNPRSKLDDDEVLALQQSIEQDGQLQVAEVEELGNGRYLVTEGNKRVKAIQQSKKVQTVRAFVSKKLSAEDRLLKQIIIDSHRSNFPLSARDVAWKKLWDMGKYDTKSFAKRLSVTPLMVEAFQDRMQLGVKFVQDIPNVAAYNITETQIIKDVDTRKKVLEYANRHELARKDIRQLSKVAVKVNPKILKEVISDEISISDAENMIGMKEERQDQALMATKSINKHKKQLKKMFKEGKVKTEDVVEVRKISDLIDEFQTEFFETSSRVRKLSNKLQYMREQNLEKYSNTAMRKILEGCLNELEDAVIPAINDIKKSLKKGG